MPRPNHVIIIGNYLYPTVSRHLLAQRGSRSAPLTPCEMTLALGGQREVFCNAQDPNDVVVLQDVGDVAKARTFLASEDQKAAMQKNGVIGSPSVRFAT
jgi:hypothetical protein